MKKIIAFFLSFFILFQAQACEDIRVGLHLGTWHVDRQVNYKEFNPGGFISCNKFTIGGFANSEYKTSYYLGYLFEYKDFGLFVGGVSGYSDKIQPMLIPSYKIPNTPIRINYLPQQPDKKKNTQGVHVNLEFKF